MARAAPPAPPRREPLAPRNVVEFVLPPLFPYQVKLVSSRAWELVIVSATQIGKTFACACWLLAIAWEHPGTLNWWCAPTKKQANNGYETMKRIAQSAGILLPGRAGFTDGKMILRLINGARIECRSWKNPGNLQGDSIYAVVLDEAGLLTAAARAVISTRRSALLGPARYIGNPSATGSAFWELHQQATEGRDAGDGYWDVFKWTWKTRLDALAPEQQVLYQRFIDNERKTMEPFLFQRWYEADWAIPEKSIFGPIIKKLEKDGKLIAPDKTPHPGHSYLVAWDIGVTSDYTVGAPLCLKCFTVTDYYRDRPGDSTGLPGKIVEYSKLWRTPAGKKGDEQLWNEPQIVIEKNGLGLVIFNEVSRLYSKVQGWETDNVNKRTAVFEVLNRLDKGGLTIARIAAMLNELTIYESQQNPKTQTWTFGAPAGAKDDIVMALLIAVGSATSGAAAYIEMLQRQLARMQEAEKNPK